MTDEIKQIGRIYTPGYIVCNILDMSGYTVDIRQKHVIDNSCGDGAFLREIVRRYCHASEGTDRQALRTELETYVHGIDIDEEECKKCIASLDAVAEEFDLHGVCWDVMCADATKVDAYNGKMDFVLGNPPYVRVHNLGESFDEVKRFSYAKQGMTDLFIVFYEIGIRMLAPSGILGYITSNSFFNSVAGGYMRREFIAHRYLKTVVDLGHFQAFEATTYTAIVILQNSKPDDAVGYYAYNGNTQRPCFVERLTPDDFYINDCFYFAKKEELTLLKNIFGNEQKAELAIKNGYATLCDKVFVGDFPFASPYIIPVIKASRGAKKQIIYPYDREGVILKEEVLQQDEALYAYLLEHKKKLKERSIDGGDDVKWYAFGRSQALHDTFKNKLAINTLVKTVADIKLTDAPPGTGVYGGLYIVSDRIAAEVIKETLLSEDFITYISLLGKYKSGGYYTFSSKDLAAYLNYKLGERGGAPNE